MKKRQKIFFITLVSMLFLNNLQIYGSPIKMRLLYDGKMHDYEAESIRIVVNQQELAIEDMPPILLYDRTLMPARAVFEALGAEVAWNAETQEVYIRRNDDVVILKADNKVANINGTEFTMDVPAKVINERTMIPVRAVSEALECTVEWDENTRTVSITEKETEEIVIPEPEKPEQTPIQDTEQKTEQQTPTQDTEQKTEQQTPTQDTEQKTEQQTPTQDTEQKTEQQTPTQSTEQKPSQENTNIAETKEYAQGGTGEIPKQNIGIVHVAPPESEKQDQTFTIIASDEIAKFQEKPGKQYEVIIDIYYGQKEILTDNMEVLTSDLVSNIISSQYRDNGTTVTRIIFELKRECEYDIHLNRTKDNIIVDFEEKEGGSVNPNINNTGTNNNTNHNNTNNNTNMGTSINTNTNQPNQIKNVFYDTSRKAITLSKSDLFAISNIEHKDDYLNKKYQILLPDDYSSIYGSGTMKLDTTELLSVTISQEQGKTAFTFQENGIYAFTITEDANYYYINVKNPKEVYDKVVVLDAGHGGQDPGTNGNGIDEKDMTLAILQKTYSKLQNTDKVKTYVTRIADTYPENIDRAMMANEIGDIFISVHMNSAKPNPTPNGTEVLFITHETDKKGKLTSKDVASVLLKNVVNALGTNNRGLKYDTSEQKNLIVLNKTVVPAVIVETLFLSNPGDALKISNEIYQENAAQAIYDSIIELANNYQWR